MRPDLQPEDVDALLRRHAELTRATRTLYRLPDEDESTSGSPFEMMAEVAKSVFVMVAIGTVAVVLIALVLSDLPVPMP